jgi:virginiamycin B lyase
MIFAVVAVSAVFVAAGAQASGPPTCTSGCITEFQPPVPAVYNGPFGIARGLGDDMWLGDQDTISRIDRSGNMTTYTVPSSGAGIGAVTFGDGAMWFAERLTNKIGRIDNLGNITEYPIPTPNSVPQAVVVAAGFVWFTEQSGNNIGRLDPATGDVTEFAVPTPRAAPLGLALGPDGALWFTERNAGKVGRMSLDGSFTEYALSPGAFPQRIVSGPDGALWVTEALTGKIARLTTDGQLTEFPLPAGSQPVGITAPPWDDAVWFVASGANAIERMTLDGVVTDVFPIPSPASSALQIGWASNRTLWFTESFLSPTGNKVGRLDPYAQG